MNKKSATKANPTWTITALECYEIGRDCSKCNLNKMYGLADAVYWESIPVTYGCQMPKTLDALLDQSAVVPTIDELIKLRMGLG